MHRTFQRVSTFRNSIYVQPKRHHIYLDGNLIVGFNGTVKKLLSFGANYEATCEESEEMSLGLHGGGLRWLTRGFEVWRLRMYNAGASRISKIRIQCSQCLLPDLFLHYYKLIFLEKFSFSSFCAYFKNMISIPHSLNLNTFLSFLELEKF